MRNSSTKTERVELQSWKEVASFLGISVRTAQKWETDLGLPIHRLGSGPGSRVTAFSDELEEWKLRVANETAERKTSQKDEPGKSGHLLPWLIALAVAAVLIATAIAVFVTGHSGPPALWSLERETFQVKDSDGSILWSFRSWSCSTQSAEGCAPSTGIRAT